MRGERDTSHLEWAGRVLLEHRGSGELGAGRDLVEGGARVVSGDLHLEGEFPGQIHRADRGEVVAAEKAAERDDLVPTAAAR